MLAICCDLSSLTYKIVLCPMNVLSLSLKFCLVCLKHQIVNMGVLMRTNILKVILREVKFTRIFIQVSYNLGEI